MTRDIQASILRACARFIGKRLEPIEKRMQALETKEVPSTQVELDSVVKEILTTDELKTLVDLHVAEAVAKHFEANPIRHGEKGDPGPQGVAGVNGVDLKDLFRAEGGRLVAVLSDGTTKDLGVFVGQDGAPGKHGLSVESLEREYLPETHEIVERWTACGQTKELRYPAGGIHDGGYWRDGAEAKTAQAFTSEGTLWIALRDTKEKPSASAKDWRLGARKGKDAVNNQVREIPSGSVKVPHG